MNPRVRLAAVALVFIGFTDLASADTPYSGVPLVAGYDELEDKTMFAAVVTVDGGFVSAAWAVKGDQKFRRRLKTRPKKVTVLFHVEGDADRPTNEVAIRTGKQLKRYKRAWNIKHDTDCDCFVESYEIQMSFSAFRRLAFFKGTALIRLGGKHDLRVTNDERLLLRVLVDRKREKAFAKEIAKQTKVATADLAKAVDALADDACACKDMACAEEVQAKLMEVVKDAKEPSKSDQEKILASMERMGECMEKLAAVE